MSYRIANRNGRPAYENAPPRMRASHIERPFGAQDKPTTPLVLRWLERWLG